MIPPLYTEDIDELFEVLIGSYPLFSYKLDNEDLDQIRYILDRHLEKFSHGSYNNN